jgi:hypothetical protein
VTGRQGVTGIETNAETVASNNFEYSCQMAERPAKTGALRGCIFERDANTCLGCGTEYCCSDSLSCCNPSVSALENRGFHSRRG